jgi:hypothetical protein
MNGGNYMNEYLVEGYPHGDGRYIEIGRVMADSKEDVLKKFNQCIWYEYFVSEFNQERYDKLKTKHHFEIRFKK